MASNHHSLTSNNQDMVQLLKTKIVGQAAACEIHDSYSRVERQLSERMEFGLNTRKLIRHAA
jgi:hypothetical protein